MGVELLIAFAGGVFGAMIGATNHFIFTGILGLLGLAISFGGGGDAFLNLIPGGPVFMPNVGFAGGVAALALCAKKRDRRAAHVAAGYEEDGASARPVLTGQSVFEPLYPFADPSTLLVGGVFAAGAYALSSALTNDLGMAFDTVALTVVLSNVLARVLLAGESPLSRVKPDFSSMLETALFDAIWAGSLALLSGFVTLKLGSPLVMFYFCASTLIFGALGKDVPATHHVALVAGYAAQTYGTLWTALLFGLVAFFLGEVVGEAVNVEAGSLIDVPSVVIATLSMLILGIF